MGSISVNVAPAFCSCRHNRVPPYPPPTTTTRLSRGMRADDDLCLRTCHCARANNETWLLKNHLWFTISKNYRYCARTFAIDKNSNYMYEHMRKQTLKLQGCHKNTLNRCGYLVKSNKALCISLKTQNSLQRFQMSPEHVNHIVFQQVSHHDH